MGLALGCELGGDPNHAADAVRRISHIYCNYVFYFQTLLLINVICFT